MNDRIKCLLVTTALAAVPAAGLAGLPAGTAQATICSPVYGGMEFTGTHVVAEKYRNCGDETIALSVGIEQKDPVSGFWVKVAAGTGVASYMCKASSPSKRYRMANTTGTGVLYAC